MKIAVGQMMFGGIAACMCVWVDSSHGTVHIMSTSIPAHLIGYTFSFLHEFAVVFGGDLYSESTYIRENAIYIHTYIH